MRYSESTSLAVNETDSKKIHFEDFIKLAWLRRQAILQAKMRFVFHRLISLRHDFAYVVFLKVVTISFQKLTL